MHEELKDHGFAVIAVALDKNADDPRPWIEAARPTHSSLVDNEANAAQSASAIRAVVDAVRSGTPVAHIAQP